MNWIYLVLIVASILPLFVVLYKIAKMKRWRKNAVATTATVVQIPMGFFNRLTTITIRYTIYKTGQVIEKQITIAGNPYSVGQQLPLLYKKEKPTETMLDSGKSYTMVLVFTIFIALFFILATYMIHQWVAEGLM